MKFAIQASNPRTTSSISEGDTTLGEAIESIFPLHTEFALLIWNDIYVPLTYKYDISIIIDDVISLLTALICDEMGNTMIYWPSSTFRARWSIEWSAEEVTIKSKWESVIGGTEPLLNKVPDLTMGKQAFVSEWESLLRKVTMSLRERSNETGLAFDLSPLDAVLNSIISQGQLYKD